MVGLLISSFSIAQLVVAPVWGRFSDRYGRRPAILAGLLVTAVAYALFAFAGSVWALLASRIVQGLGGGTIGVVQAYVADASTPEQRTKSLGWLSAVTSLGAVVGPAFGSLMVALGGQKLPGLAAAALSVLVAVFAWRYLRESREMRLSGTSSCALDYYRPRRDRPGTLPLARTGAPSHLDLCRRHRRLLRNDSDGAPTAQGAARHHRAECGLLRHVPGRNGCHHPGPDPGRAVDRLGEARLSRVGLVLLGGGLVLTGLAHGLPVLLLGFTLMPLGTAFLFPCVTGLLSRVVRAGERGLYMGVQHTFGGISRVAFPIASGVLMDHADVGVPFLGAGLLVFLTIPLARGVMAVPEPEVQPEVLLSAADITGEMPIPSLQDTPNRS